VRLYGAAEALREEFAFPYAPTDLTYHEPVQQRLRDTLGADRYAAAWAAGRALSRDAALSEALALRVDTVEEAPRAAPTV
jgi:hypothetical protein